MRRWAILVVLGVIVAMPLESGEPTADGTPTRGASAPVPATYGGQSAAQWIQGLTQNSARVRATAARALAEAGSEEAVGPLVARSADPDPDVRMNVAYALGRINKLPARSIPALRQLLEDRDEHVRYSAQWSLGQIAASFPRPEKTSELDAKQIGELLASAAARMSQSKAPEGLQRRVAEAAEKLRSGVGYTKMGGQRPGKDDVPRLLEELQTADLYVQARAIEQLKRLDQDAVPLLLRGLAARGEAVALDWELAKTIGAMGPAIMPPLLEGLAGDNEIVRDLVLRILGEMGHDAKGALAELNKIIASEDASEEQLPTVLMTIANIGPAAKESTDLLVRVAANTDHTDFIRIEALRALAAIGPDAAVASPILMKLLQSGKESEELRIEALGAVAKVRPRPKETAQMLIRLIEETEDADLAAGLAAKLRVLGADAAAAVPMFVRMIEDLEMDAIHRQEVALALGEIGAPALVAIPTLVGRLADADEESTMQVASAIALGKLGPSAVSALARELENETPATRLTIVRALMMLGEQAAPAAENLIRKLDDGEEDNEVRVLVAVALGKIGAPATGAVPTLTRLLQDQENDDQLRAMCAVAIGCIDPAAMNVLLGVINDASKDVQVAAAFAICKTPHPDRAAAMKLLLSLLSDEEAEELAARALADIGKDAIPLLLAAARDTKNEMELRSKYIEVLGSTGKEAAEPLLALLNDTEVCEAARNALKDQEPDLVPVLLAAAEDESKYTPEAREEIRELVRYFNDGLGAGDDDLSWPDAHPLARLECEMLEMRGGATFMGHGNGRIGAAPKIRIGPPLAVMGKQPDEVPAEGFKTVKVFYGTNRKPAAAGAAVAFRFLSLQGLGLAALAICLACLLWQTPKNSLAIVASSIGLVVLAGPQLVPLWRAEMQVDDVAAPAYGGQFSDQVEMGVCDVTIPEIHDKGELEGPSILRLEIKVDPEKHIVLKSVQHLEKDHFFTALKGEMEDKGDNILVFVHGYNVSFEDAARRTAQMAADLEFPGAAAFYSWPSQAHWYKYRLDEKNVELSVKPLKGFLLEVAERSGATTINLVAHSMGNRALTGALKQIDASARENDVLFNQVILAAPDIDAAIFKQDIAPEIVTKAKRVTLYASSKDLALFASRQFNSGDSRAGDVGEDLVVVPGIETIDASAGDCSLLGHCYYGDSVSVLRDIEHLLKDEPAQARPFLHPRDYKGMTYWMFEPTEVASEIRVIR